MEAHPHPAKAPEAPRNNHGAGQQPSQRRSRTQTTSVAPMDIPASMCRMTLGQRGCVARYGGHPQGVPLRVVIQSRRVLQAWLQTRTTSVASTGDAITLASPWTRTHMLRRRPTRHATITATAYDPQGRPLWSPPTLAAQQPSRRRSQTQTTSVASTGDAITLASPWT